MRSKETELEEMKVDMKKLQDALTRANDVHIDDNEKINDKNKLIYQLELELEKSKNINNEISQQQQHQFDQFQALRGDIEAMR